MSLGEEAGWCHYGGGRMVSLGRRSDGVIREEAGWSH